MKLAQLISCASIYYRERLVSSFGMVSMCGWTATCYNIHKYMYIYYMYG